MRSGFHFVISLLQLRFSSFSIILLHNNCYLTGSGSVILSSLLPFFACIRSLFLSSSPSFSLNLLDCPFSSTL